jgi:ubiquinone/menaquinone biosynthesis C-methylase UbiE
MKKINILDIGCGIGQNLNLLSKKGIYYGIDISSKNIKNNQKKFPQHNFAIADITSKTEFKDNFFNEIYCYDVMEHVTDLNKALNEIHRIINKKNGKLIVEVPTYFSESVFTKLNPNYNKQVGHKRNLTEKEWIKKIKKYGFFLYKKKNKKFNDFLYLMYKIFKGKNIINEMGEFNEGIPLKEDKLNSQIWLLNNQLTNKLYSPLYGKSLRLEFKTKSCKLKKYKNDIHIIEKINFENQELKSRLDQIQNSKFYKLWQKYNNIKKTFKIFTIIEKQSDDFTKYGWPGVRLKIKNRFIYLFIYLKAKKISSQAKIKNQKSILIINGAEKTVSEVHRVFHFQDKLKLLKIPYLTISNNITNKLPIDCLTNFDLLYIHRSNTEGKILDLINQYHKLKKKAIYDIDDLIFDKDQINNITFIKKGDKFFRQNFINQANQHLKIMKMADLVTTPTDFLSNYINKKFQIPSAVLRNHLDQNSLNKGITIFNKKNNSKDINNNITIGYFPGTKTHQKDFKTIEKIIFQLLSKHPNLRLKIVGELSLKNIPKEIKKQIFKQKKVPYKKMMEIYKNVDINLAPLEMNNDFCESKSELKYFFAGACGIPTIASATDAFKYAITNGVNSYLCYESKDWKNCLTKLIKNKKKRHKISKNAFNQTNQEYTPKYQTQQLNKLLKKINFYD